jgi:predicted dithiol-disulfide oxidoreductase (DUF899 family)
MAYGIEAFNNRMDWSFPWVSSYASDFNCDDHVSHTKEELDRAKAFYNFELRDSLDDGVPIEPFSEAH